MVEATAPPLMLQGTPKKPKTRDPSTSLPVGALVHPVSLAAMAAMAANDWILKPMSWAPRWITGKLSDFAGLVFSPLLLMAMANMVLLCASRFGFRCDFYPRRWKLWLTTATMMVFFSACKVSPTCANVISAALSFVFPHSRIMADVSDLVALPALGVALWLGESDIQARTHSVGCPPSPDT